MKRAFAFLIMAWPAALAGQEHQHVGGPAVPWSWGGQAIGLVTHATPATANGDLTEAYLTQPNFFLHASWRGLSAQTTVNLEGLTLRNGELNAGTWGEGFFDKRHPHTYVHEAIASLAGSVSGISWSISGGKGFAPFGSDDPMVRPLIKFPANHHLAQVLERLVAIGAVATGPVVIEAGVFNGDEPLTPKSMGELDRFADSWAARATVMPMRAYEVSVSHAFVKSPEQREGFGLDQSKWAVSLRHERTTGEHPHYFLVEWLRTGERADGEERYALHSVLAEGSADRGPWRAALRAERTVRAEEERTSSIFRSPWPHADEHIFGFTRWWIVSANVSRAFQGARWNAVPMIEVSHQRPRKETPFFTPDELYGSDKLWSVSLGLRIGAGASHRRMGRYGVAQLGAMH